MTFKREVSNVAGVDEVGRGPLAGDVVAAAVILPDDHGIEGLADSKKLTERKREILFDQIKASAICWSVARASVEEIDRLNILQASLLAMKRAVDGLTVRLDHAYPGYGFAKHKGYPTKQHITALQSLGVTKIHRRSYAPVQKALSLV